MCLTIKAFRINELVLEAFEEVLLKKASPTRPPDRRCLVGTSNTPHDHSNHDNYRSENDEETVPDSLLLQLRDARLEGLDYYSITRRANAMN